MPRKKVSNPQQLLSHTLIIRINETTFKRLQKLQQQSHYPSIAEVVRRILGKQKIKLYYRDTTLDGLMEKLALIRKELKAIGININQQTRYFHTSRNSAERTFYA